MTITHLLIPPTNECVQTTKYTRINTSVCPFSRTAENNSFNFYSDGVRHRLSQLIIMTNDIIYCLNLFLQRFLLKTKPKYWVNKACNWYVWFSIPHRIFYLKKRCHVIKSFGIFIFYENSKYEDWWTTWLLRQ